MGLDNGLLLHSKEQIEGRPSFIKPTTVWSGEEYPFSYEICYWRKCWNIRREVQHAIGAPADDVNKFGLDIAEVKNIWHAINELNSETAWGNDSIWSYEEIKDHLDRDLNAIEWLIWFMRQYEDDESWVVEFYDSY